MMEHLVQCRSPCTPIPCSTLCTPPPCSTLCTPPPCSTPCTPPCVLHVDLAGVVEGGKQGPPAGDGYLIYWLEGDHFAYHSTSFYQHQAEEQWQKIHSRSKWVGLGTWPHRALPQFSAKKERWEKKPKICFGLLKYVCIFTLTRDDTPKTKHIVVAVEHLQRNCGWESSALRLLMGDGADGQDQPQTFYGPF